LDTFEGSNYVQRVLSGLSYRPERVVSFDPTGRSITGTDFIGLVNRVAHVLSDYGVGYGSTVSIISHNRTELIAIRYAVNLLGAKIVSLHDGMSTEIQARIVADVESEILIIDARLASSVKQIFDCPASVKHILTIGHATIGEDLLSLASTASDTPIPAYQMADSDIWCIRYTGGTSGHPKGIPLTNSSYLQIMDYLTLGKKSPDVRLICTPLSHAAAMGTDVTLASGGSIVIHEQFDAGKVLADISTYKVTSVWLLPPLLYQLLDHPSLAATDTSSLRRVSYGGCSSSPSRLADAVQKLGPVLYQFYAQMETGGVSYLSPQEHLQAELLTTVGKPNANVSLRIVDRAGKEVPMGVSGEILIRTSMAANGYWKNPRATEEVWRDGWVHTGDIGYLDRNGYLHLKDRIKDMVIVMGGHVYTAEVEDALLRHPAIAGAAVLGKNSIDAVEQVHAALVLHPGQTIDLEAVQMHINKLLGSQYVPQSITVLDSIPLTAEKKPDKKTLREQIVPEKWKTAR
jgi:fatty-acyl-CoA synthase